MQSRTVLGLRQITVNRSYLFFGKANIMNDKLKGLFWGLVVGDCLGSPVQFTNKDNHPYITEMVPCEMFNTPAGYWTDDSAMALCVAESYVRLKSYSCEDIAQNFVRWFDDGFCSSLDYAFDIGGATRQAIRGIKSGSIVNGVESTQGNGSIMRYAPSYIINLGEKDNTIIHEISNITHNSKAVRDTLDLMTQIVTSHVSGHRTEVRSIYSTRAEVNNSGWAISTLQAALWAFETTSTFEEGLIQAVNLGGDADSIGAVFGQIGGAYYGYDAIPSRWLDKITNFEEVNSLIEKLIDLKSDSSGN